MNTFLVSKHATSQSVPAGALVVSQNIASPTKARCVAIVDRSADVDEAARAITTARFGFGGSSPYAPDLVLVNEFVKKEFFEACSRYATLAFAEGNSAKVVTRGQDDDCRRAIEDAESRKQVSSFGSKEFKLVEILDR